MVLTLLTTAGHYITAIGYYDNQYTAIFNDPYGENWHRVLRPMAEKEGVRIVASERYARTDQSVTGQVLKLLAAKPDAMYIAAVGGPAVLPQATLRDHGWKGTVYQTHAVATNDFITLGRDKVEGTVLAVTHDRWFARSFDRFLVFGADGAVYESDEPVWDEARVARER